VRALLTNIPFAVVVTATSVVASAAIAADTSDSPTHLLGVLAMSAASGAGSCWVGTLVRWRRGRQD